MTTSRSNVAVGEEEDDDGEEDDADDTGGRIRETCAVAVQLDVAQQRYQQRLHDNVKLSSEQKEVKQTSTHSCLLL